MTQAIAPRRAPGPSGSLLLGSTLSFKDSPLEFVQYIQRAYGDVARFRMAIGDWYLISHPDLIWEVLSKQQDVFLKPRVARRLWKPFLGNGLLTAEGAEWQRMHSMMRPAMHGGRLQAYAADMTAYTEQMVDSWTTGEERDAHVDMTGLTLRIVARCLFDTDVAGDAGLVGDAMELLQRTMVEHIHMPLPVPRWWPSQSNRRKIGAVEDIRGIVRRLIDERRASGEDHGDLLSMLIQARSEDGVGMNDQEVFDQAVTLFFAGHETSANALTWALYLLARHPEVTQRLQKELDDVLQGRRASASDLRELPYLDQVLKESMRILPPVWVYMKEPTRDVEIGGYLIPKGAQVMISPYVVQHDARWWPSPETFDPDRFHKDKIAAIPRGAYVPFSGGKRVCFGKSFAMMELRLVIATMLQMLTPAVPVDHWPRKRAELSMHPEGGMPFIVVPRASGPRGTP